MTLIYGGPGSGKTALTMRLVHERLRRGEKAFWISLAEGKDLLLDYAKRLGYDLSGAEIWSAMLADPFAVMNHVVAAVSELAPSVIVIDQITSLSGVDVASLALNALYRAIRESGTDVLLTAAENVSVGLAHLADNVVHLYRPKGSPLWYMEVEKSRLTSVGPPKPFEIAEGRGVVFLDELSLTKKAAKLYKTGVAELDEALGGGLPPGLAVLRGPPHAPVMRLAAKAAAGLSKSSKAIFALGDERLLEAAQREGGGLKVVDAPLAGSVHRLCKALEDEGAEVVVGTLGPLSGPELDALSWTASVLRRAGAAALALTYWEDARLEALADVVIAVSSDWRLQVLKPTYASCGLDPRTAEVRCEDSRGQS